MISKPARLFPALFLISFLLCACGPDFPPGTIASVNGEPIHLHYAQALMDSRSSALGIPPRPSVSEMRRNYRDALAILIAHALVRQELAERGLAVSDKDVDEAINGINRDFGDESLADFLADASLRQDEWRRLMRDHIGLEIFTDEILLPAIRIPLAEVRAYYEEHKRDFSLPENSLVCFAGGESRDAVAAWCENAGKKDFEPGPMAQCMEVTAREIPEAWEDDFKKLRPGACGKIIEEGGQWRAIALLARNPAKNLPLSEAYPLIESILIDQKKSAAFDAWLEKKINSSRILVNPEIFPAQDKSGDESVF